MNIPDEVIRRAEDAQGRHSDGMLSPEAFKAGYQVIAEWARKEALREAADAVRFIPCWADGKGNSGFDVGPDPVRVVREAVRALAEGDTDA